MVLEGLKKQILAFETLARAHDSFFPKIDTFQNRVLLVNVLI